jgi:hypothetical protein
MMQSDIEEITRFLTKVQQCPNDRVQKEALLSAYRRLSTDTRDNFIEISRTKLQLFINERDSQKVEFFKKRFLSECDSFISVRKMLMPISQFVADCNGYSVNPSERPASLRPFNLPVDPSSSTAAILDTGTFDDRTVRLPLVVEAATIELNRMTPLQKQQAKAIVSMGKFLADDYVAPGDNESLSDKYQCPIVQDGPMDTPVFHGNISQHPVNASSVCRILQNTNASSHKCAICRAPLSASIIKINVSLQNEIAAKLVVGLAAMTDDAIVARMGQILNDLSQESAAGGRTVTISRDCAKARLVTLLKELPDDIYTRFKTLYVDRVAST